MDAIDPAPWAPVLEQVTAWIVPAGTILALAMGGLLWWQIRRRSMATVGRAVTTPLVLAWEAQGLHHLAVITGAVGIAAWVLALVTSAVLITLAAFADDHHRKHGSLGWPGRLVWMVAVPMGLVVALTATTAAEFALRIILPLLVALVWWVPYAPTLTGPTDPDGAAPRRRVGSWRFTPRRIGVALGLIDPTDADLSVVHEERQIRRLTVAAHKLHHGVPWLRSLRAARLRRLGLVATAPMVDEVARRVALVHRIAELTAPTRAPQPDTPTVDARAATAPDADALAADARAAIVAGARALDDDSARAVAEALSAGTRAKNGAATRAKPAPDAPSRATPADRRARAYAQYAAHVERDGTEPDGETCAQWLGIQTAGAGRKTRTTWRAQYAREIVSGARSRPANLPGEIAALLPPQARTRAPEPDAAPAAARALPVPEDAPAAAPA